MADFGELARRVRQALPLAEYLRRRYGVELRRVGSELACRCPLPGHDDKRPSFTLDENKGVWCCHSHPGGRLGGDLITLHERLGGFGSRGEAIQDLARSLGLSLESSGSEPRKTKRRPAKRRKRPPSGAAGKWDASPPPPPQLTHPKLGKPSKTWEVRDPQGRLFGVHARFDREGAKKEVLWWRRGIWSLKRWGLSVADAPLWGAERLPPGAEAVWVTEGEKAAEALREWVPAVGTCSGSGIPSRRPLLVLRGRRVVLWPDKDRVGAEHMAKLADALRELCREVMVLAAPEELSATGDAWDWLESRRGCDPEEVRRDLEALEATATPAYSSEPIRVELDERSTNDAALAAVAARERNLFQRAGSLVHIVRDLEPRSWGVNGSGVQVQTAAGSARIALVEPPRLRETVAEHCRFLKRDSSGEWVPAKVPMHLPGALMARGTWPEIRPLRAISQSPVFRPDGSIHQVGGWDRATGVYYQEDPALRFDPVPAEPSLRQALRARDRLLEAVGDFPFRGEADKAAWLALVLTVVCRPAFEGVTPLFLVDATTPGSGKGLLIEAAALITTGHSVALAGWPTKAPEQEKLITALLLEGSPFVSFDNVRGFLGGPELDRLLTAKRWRGRILGRTETVELPNQTIWCATGNNVDVGGDTSRRALQIRLEPLTDRPELRTGFAHPNLTAWLAAERRLLLPAALTILREFWREVEPHTLAPDQLSEALIHEAKLPPFGMAEEWSALVRRMLVRLEMPDPAETREELRAGSSDLSGLSALIDAIEAFLSEEGLTRATASQLAAAEQMQTVWGDLLGIDKSKPPNSRRVGRLLGKHAGRWADGRKIVKAGTHSGILSWSTFRSESPDEDLIV